MRLSKDEEKVIRAMRSGADVNVSFHGSDRWIDETISKGLVEEFQPKGSRIKYAETDNTKWYQAENKNFEITVFFTNPDDLIFLSESELAKRSN